MKCQFCGYDYSQVGLRDGRCRNCGSKLAWEDEGGEIPEDLELKIPIPGMPSAQPAPAPVNSEALAPPAPKPNRSNDEGKVESPGSGTWPSTELSPEDHRMLTACWENSAASDVTPRMTLKGGETGTVVASTVRIQPRELRNIDESQDRDADYELLDVIGEGGVGVVYSARQLSIERDVAVKMLKGRDVSDEGQRDKFLSEAVVTGDLDHPNIVPIHDLGRNSSGELFYAMKHVRGTPWDKVLPQKTLAENLDILMKIADAVAFAHSRGVIHRDLKPENVMLGDFGEVLLMDWGLALPTTEFRRSHGLGHHDVMGGTPAYMAPEMAKGPLKEVDQRADVYLLGAILYEIVTGTTPHTGKSVMDCLASAAANRIQPTDKTGELIEIARCAMATDTARRYRTVRKFQEAIRSYQSHSESVLLSSRAERDLETALQTNQYEDFARVVFALQEALELWDGNSEARGTLDRARVEYARCALAKGDYDLGLSQLDERNPEHEPLMHRLRSAQEEREARQMRLKHVRRLVVLLVVLLFVGGTFAMAAIIQKRNEALEALGEKETALGEKEAAMSELEIALSEKEAARAEVASALIETDKQRERAVDAAERAKTEKARADEERDRAENLRLEAVAAREAAEEQAYLSEIGLGGEKLLGNAYGVAYQLLIDQQQSPPKSRIRHWEWGRYFYLCNGGFRDAVPKPVISNDAEMAIESVAISSNGEQVLIAGSDRAEIWERAGRRSRAVLRHGGDVHVARFSPDGRWVATGGSDSQGGCVKLWSLGDQPPEAPEHVLRIQGTSVLDVAFSPDGGRRLATAGDDKVIKIWDWKSETDKTNLLGHLDEVTGVRFSPGDGRYVVSASMDGTVRIWDANSPRELQRFRGHTGPVFAADFSPDGRHVASAGYGQRILIWKVQPQAESDSWVVDDVKMRVAGLEVPEPEYRELRGHTDTVRDLVFSPDGRLLISASHDNTLGVWDVTAEGNAGAPRPGNRSATPQEELFSLLSARADAVESSSRLLLRLRGHGGWVRSCDISADGASVVSGGYDNQWKTWRLVDYQEQYVLKGRELPLLDEGASPMDASGQIDTEPVLPVLAADFSPDGQRAVTALDDGTVRIWNYVSGQQVGILREGHEFLTSTGLFFPDGQRLLTAAGDNTTRVWEISTGTQLLAIPHTGPRAVVALSSDGRRILAGGDAKAACLFDADSGRLLHRLDPHQQTLVEMQERNPEQTRESLRDRLPDVTAVAFSRDGRLVFVGDAAGRCRLWDAESGELRRELTGHYRGVTAGAFLPPGPVRESLGPLLLTAGADDAVIQWNVETGAERPDSRLAHPYAVNLMALAADGSRLLTTSAAGPQLERVHLWDVAKAELIDSRDFAQSTINSIAFTPDGSAALIAAASTTGAERNLWQWRFAQNDLAPFVGGLAGGSTIRTALLSPDGQQLLTVGGKGAKLWDVKRGRLMVNFRPQNVVPSIAYSPDGKYLATAGGDGSIKIWDVATRKSVQKLQGVHTGTVASVDYSPDGSLLATAGEDGLVVLWNPLQGTVANGAAFERQDEAIWCVRFSPDGTRLLTTSESGSAIVWDAATRRAVLPPMVASSEGVLCGIWSADGRWLITGGRDKTARIWSSDDGQLLATLTGHSAAVTSVAISLDRMRVLTASQDNTAKLWDSRSLRRQLSGPRSEAEDLPLVEVLTFRRHTREVTTVRFSRDGRHVLTASRDGRTIVWPGEYLAPAINLSGEMLHYPLGTGPRRIDPRALLSCPSLPDFDSARLEFWLEASTQDTLEEELAFGRDGDGASRVSFQEDHILYTSDGETNDIGTWQVQESGRRLTVTFNAQATMSAVQAVLRMVSYEGIGEDVESTVSVLHCQLTDSQGRTGNASPETKSIQVIVPQ